MTPYEELPDQGKKVVDSAVELSRASRRLQKAINGKWRAISFPRDDGYSWLCVGPDKFSSDGMWRPNIK